MNFDMLEKWTYFLTKSDSIYDINKINDELIESTFLPNLTVFLKIFTTLFNYSVNSMKMHLKTALCTTNPTIDHDKENKHPNMIRQAHNCHPKVSSFSPDISHPSKDWRERLLNPSER